MYIDLGSPRAPSLYVTLSLRQLCWLLLHPGSDFFQAMVIDGLNLK